MTPMRAKQADVLRNFFLTSLTNEHPVTRRVVDAIPQDKVNYRPHDVAKSANDLAWHIVSAEHRFLAAVVSGTFEFGAARPDGVKTVADVSEWYASAFERDVDEVKSLSADALVKTIDFRGLFQFPAVVSLQIGLNHSIHHRGQLSVYLRSLGAKVPSIYGESYD